MRRHYIVQLVDGRYYRRDREPRHFQHNATRLSFQQATAIVIAQGGTIVDMTVGPTPLGS